MSVKPLGKRWWSMLPTRWLMCRFSTQLMMSTSASLFCASPLLPPLQLLQLCRSFFFAPQVYIREVVCYVNLLKEKKKKKVKSAPAFKCLGGELTYLAAHCKMWLYKQHFSDLLKVWLIDYYKWFWGCTDDLYVHDVPASAMLSLSRQQTNTSYHALVYF